MTLHSALNAVKAGTMYCAGVFALGFLFGGIRLMLLEPLAGATAAVAIEVPIMLVLAWVLCSRTVKVSNISSDFTDRLLMGLVALTLLLLAEFALSVSMFGNQPVAYLRNLATAAGAIGLGGQILFSLFPLLQIHVNHKG